MKFLHSLRLAAVATLIASLSVVAFAQTVTQQPQFIAPNTVKDLGNGPIELRTVLGNAWVFTSSGSGVGSTSGSSTALTLTATAAANPPCVSCIISGTGITSGTTVAAFNGTTGITLSAAMTVAASTPVAWGVACPAFSGGLPAPNVPLQQGTSGTDLPLYTQARICGYSANGPGATVLPFAIGAH